MSKSTPINQLPSAAGSMPFINEQQKHMVTQAQQATQSFTLPQNTQQSTDVTLMDDDATIQEVLNELNMPLHDTVAAAPTPTAVPQYETYAPPPPMHVPVPEPPVAVASEPIIAVEKHTSIFGSILSYLLDDVKLMAVIIVAFALIQLLPIGQVMQRYFAALITIPYSILVVRSVLAGLVAYLGIKFLSRT